MSPELHDLYTHVIVGNQWVDATTDSKQYIKFYTLSNYDSKEISVANPISLKFLIVVNSIILEVNWLPSMSYK